MTQEINPKNGIRKSFYKDGALRYEARYRRGKPHGMAYGYYPDGNLKTQDSYKRGLRNGMAVGYYHNGTTKSETLYKNGKKHGVHREYDEDGNLIYEARYKKDILQMRKIVEQNGNEQYLCTDKDFESEYIKGDDANTIKERRYYPNGALWMETTLRADSVDDTPVMHGIRCYYRPDGTLISEMPYCDDVLEGVRKRYDEEGKLVEEIPYQRGKKNGLSKWRDVYGECFANYKDGLRHGEAYTRDDGKCFYKEGKLHGECRGGGEIKKFKNGVLHGLYRRYFVGLSNPYLVIPYKNGKIGGVVKYYSQPLYGAKSRSKVSLECLNGGRDMVYRSFMDGRVEEIEILKDFRPVVKQYYRYKNGVMESEELYKNGLLETYREYYDTGVLFEERQYCLGELSVERRYYPSGKIFSETPYEEGERAGETKYYDEEGNLSDNARCVAKFYNDGQSLCIEQIFSSDGRFLRIDYHKGIVTDEYYKDGEYEIGRWYYDNGLLSEEWRHRNGLKDGVQRSYYADGTLASQETYRYVREEYDGVVVEDSYPVGEHQEFYKDGKLRSYTRYEDGNPIGVSKTYHPDGTLESKKTHRRKPPKKLIPLKNGKPHGIAIIDGHSEYYKKTYHYKNGRLIKCCEKDKAIHYKEGKPSLIVQYGYKKIDEKRFYKKGVLSKQEFFHKEGVERTYYGDDGYGVRRLHYANGQVSREVLYRDGVEDSTICEYREDGSLLYENYYDGERQTWVRKVYERDGEVKLEYFQKSSRLSGSQRGGMMINDGGEVHLEHYANGNVRYESFEAHQIREERYYYEDGGLQSELGGDGLWRYYHRNGSLCYEGDDGGIKEQDYRRAFESNTLWDFTKKYYYYDGGVESEIPYKDSLPHGVERRYYRDGGLKCEISHYKGKREGEVRCYSQDGALEATALYQDDRLIDGEDGASRLLSSRVLRELLKCYGVLVPKMQSCQSQQLENSKSNQI